MRAVSLVSVALSLTLLGCSGKDADDSGPTGDNTTETGGETDDTGEPPAADTGTSEPVEDCTDGADNDGDGLADCEDEDCLDVCLEDCADDLDNDGDGAIGCDDDECLGDPRCPTVYDMELRPRFEALGWADGPGIEAAIGYPQLAVLYGYVEVVGTPQDTGVEGFLCEGVISGATYSGGYYPHALTIDTGDCDGCDLHVIWEASTANNSLVWSGGDCPLTALPSADLGLLWKEIYITRQTEGVWAGRYYTSFYDYAIDFPGSAREQRVQRVYNMRPLTPYTWSAAYEL